MAWFWVKGHRALSSQIAQEVLDFKFARFPWMALVVEQDELTNPASVSLFATQAVINTSVRCGR